MRILLAALIFAAFPALAADVQFEEREIKRVCDAEFCMLRVEDYLWLIGNVDLLVKRVEEMQKAGPKCAKTEVTEPSKNPAPKPIPYIKPERDS